MIRTVLLVDDDEDIRRIGQICLSRVGGWEALLAATAEEAVRIARDRRPDVVLLDLMLAEGSGLDVLQALRDDPRTAALPVVFLTAKVQRGALPEGLPPGASGAIPKPFDPLRLPAQLRELLEGAV